MDPSVSREVSLFSSPILIILPLFLLAIIIWIQTKSAASKREHLPPGPYPWPIVGNLLHMGKDPHISLAKLAQTHGPLMSLKLGTQLMVVGSTPAAAIEILKTHDRVLSARYYPKSGNPEIQAFMLSFSAECHGYWRSLRSMCQFEFFSTKAIESQSLLREEKVHEMVKFIETREGGVVKIGEIVFSTISNILGNICFSKDFMEITDQADGKASRLRGIMSEMMKTGATPNICDFYPIFEKLDPQGLRNKCTKLQNQVFEIWSIIIKERRERRMEITSASKTEEDFLDVMLNSGFSDIQINTLVLELFSAGAATTTTSIEWAMSEILKDKEVMDKIYMEIRSVICPTSTLNESHISQLPYLHACFKETLRLHPPGPFLIPHYALDTCEIMNYTIPKKTQVLVNVWAIGRDPISWKEPLCFKPERFLDSDIDFKGKNFELLPFSSGRRMCPGLPLATKQVHLILASLLHYFEWNLPGNKDLSQLDMGEKFSITLEKNQPLAVIPKRIV